jgi:CSLREA domain-containing protein
MRKSALAIIGLVLLCLIAALGTASASPGTFTVNTTDDTDDSACDTSHCSLREAIDAANSEPGSTIEFNIPTTDTGYEVSGITGTWTISLTSSLPSLTGGGTIISGTTQADNQGDLNPDGPEIEVSGASMGSGSCFTIQSAGNVIHGLVINSCALDGVRIVSAYATGNTVSGNYIGTDAAGVSPAANLFGVTIQTNAANNVLGGDTEGERNIISANERIGVYLSGVMSNTVSGNYIGTDVTGTLDRGNGWEGVSIINDAHNNTVGGDTEGERNIISGNERYGVRIDDGIGNTISGNYIGTDVTGTLDRGNSWDGVSIFSGSYNNTVGANNLIAHNDYEGVYVCGPGSTGNTITQNSIHSNGDEGILLVEEGNDDIPAPTISAADGCLVSGSAAAGDTVEVFTGPDDEGKTYLGTALADGDGDWSLVGAFPYDAYVTATATDASGNTSEFSAAAAPGDCYPVFVPLTMKSY